MKVPCFAHALTLAGLMFLIPQAYSSQVPAETLVITHSGRVQGT